MATMNKLEAHRYAEDLLEGSNYRSDEMHAKALEIWRVSKQDITAP